MTNAVAVIGLTFDGTDVQDADFGIFLEIVRGLNEGASVRGTDWVVPGRAGRIAGNREGDRLPIELRGVVMGDGVGLAAQRADFAALREQVRALFPTDGDPAPLVATLEDGSTATIQARTINRAWIDGDADAELSIEMESVDPDWVIEPPAP